MNPQSRSLIEAFALHGLGPNGGAGLLSLIHEDLGNQVGGTRIEANVVQFAEECLSASPDAATVHHDGGLSWEEEPLMLTEGSIEGEIPKYRIGAWCITMWAKTLMAIVQRFLQTVTVIRLPFTLVNSKKCIAMILKPTTVGLRTLYLPERTAKSRRLAMGYCWLGRDPDFAASGDYVWGNDLGGEVNGQQQGEYQNGSTINSSPQVLMFRS